MNEHTIKQPLSRWWLTALLIGINVAVFVIQMISGVNPITPSIPDMLHWGANFVPLTLTGDDWRLVSSMFLHVGAVHLAVNMWALFLFGSYAELYFRRPFYLCMYVLAGIMGSLAACWYNLPFAQALLVGDQSQLPMVSAGASGAIMGIGGALIVAAWRPRADLPAHLRINPKAMLILMGINVVLGVLVPNIDNAAHLGGAVTGVLLAWMFNFTQIAPAPLRGLLRVSCLILMAAAAAYGLAHLHEQAKDLDLMREALLQEMQQIR